jgi:hypothetical protein
VRTTGIAAVAALLASLLFPHPAPAQEARLFVGVKACLGCHARLPGSHFIKWQGSRHAKAFEALKGGETTDPACLACHSTGAGAPWAAGLVAREMEGVQCEGCHGPGSAYAFDAVMRDRGAAIGKGLVAAPMMDVCQRCHR